MLLPVGVLSDVVRCHVREDVLDDDDAELAGGLQVDVVDTGARASDHLERGAGRQDVRVDLGRRAHEQRVVALLLSTAWHVLPSCERTAISTMSSALDILVLCTTSTPLARRMAGHFSEISSEMRTLLMRNAIFSVVFCFEKARFSCLTGVLLDAG